MPEVWYYKKIREQDNKIKELEKEIERLKKEKEEDKRKIGELETELKDIAERKSSKRPKFPDYSLQTQEKSLLSSTSGKSTGRIRKKDKFKEIDRVESIYPKGVLPEDCCMIRERIIIHLKDGKKEVVLYRIFKKKWSKAAGRNIGTIPNVLPRSEYGIEVIIAVAFLVYGINVPLDKARMILDFFCNIQINKSQLNNLLNQLSEEWKKEFDNIANIILLSLVVYIDETGWRVGKKNCYAWIFTTVHHTLLLCGRDRSEKILDSILPRNTFEGIGVSDCFRFYENYFTVAQKCWAHFLRISIRLMLLNPEKKRYRNFFNSLINVFHKGKIIKDNNKLSREQKEARATSLMKRVVKMCTLSEKKLTKKTPKDYREFVNLQKRLVRNQKDLFTFVYIPEVEPTNNRAERGFRNLAKAKNNYQTSKTDKGAKRRSIITSVLTSLRQNLPEFSLKSISEEVASWKFAGVSIFKKQLTQMQAGLSP